MPLPLLVPIGLGLTALATGAYGAKKKVMMLIKTIVKQMS